MLLRASGEHEQTEFNLNSVTDDQLDSGVPNSQHLRALTEASIRGDWLKLASIRAAADAAMGPQQAVDALVVAAAFKGITRVADATGIPLGHSTAEQTDQMRALTGIEQFDYAAKTERYG